MALSYLLILNFRALADVLTDRIWHHFLPSDLVVHTWTKPTFVGCISRTPINGVLVDRSGGFSLFELLGKTHRDDVHD
jgi:hypothetical protein